MISKPKPCSACGQSKIIWKNHEGEKFCKDCWYKKEPVKFPKQRMPLKGKSDKRAVLDQIYSVTRKQFLTSHPYCTARLEGCSTHATDVHHKSGRSKQYLNQTTWLAVCRSCHQWITDNSKEAIEMGLSTSRIQDEDTD